MLDNLSVSIYCVDDVGVVWQQIRTGFMVEGDESCDFNTTVNDIDFELVFV